MNTVSSLPTSMMAEPRFQDLHLASEGAVTSGAAPFFPVRAHFLCFPEFTSGVDLLAARGDAFLLLSMSACSRRPPGETLARLCGFFCDGAEQGGASGSVVGVGLSVRRLDAALLPPGTADFAQQHRIKLHYHQLPPPLLAQGLLGGG